MTDPQRTGAARDALEARIRALQEAAGQLEGLRDATPDDIRDAVVETQSCCGTCTLVSQIPPCQNACIKISPLF